TAPSGCAWRGLVGILGSTVSKSGMNTPWGSLGFERMGGDGGGTRLEVGVPARQCWDAIPPGEIFEPRIEIGKRAANRYVANIHGSAAKLTRAAIEILQASIDLVGEG